MSMRILDSQGHTIAELLVCLATASLLLANGIPQFAKLKENLEASQFSNDFTLLLQQARTKAFSSQQTVIICPWQNSTCTSNWKNPIKSFMDENGNAHLEPNEQVLSTLEAYSAITLDWKGMGSKTYLRMSGRGLTPTSNGTFHLCLRGELFRQIIINRQGRIRSATPITTDC